MTVSLNLLWCDQLHIRELTYVRQCGSEGSFSTSGRTYLHEVVESYYIV